MLDPSGPRLGAEPIEFFSDMVQSQLGAVTLASFGVCRVVKRPFLMDVSEYHDTCCEIVLPQDGDVLMHVAPAVPEKEFPFDLAEVFLVPRGTVVCLRAGCLAPRAVCIRHGGGELPDRPARRGPT